jgi:hypothetical protein
VPRVTLGRVRRPRSRETIPTTVLIGETDNLLSDADRKWAEEHIDDIRVIDTDRFIIFRHPEVVADLALEALGPTELITAKNSCVVSPPTTGTGPIQNGMLTATPTKLATPP